jgi:hypothetical protein
MFKQNHYTRHQHDTSVRELFKVAIVIFCAVKGCIQNGFGSAGGPVPDRGFPECLLFRNYVRRRGGALLARLDTASSAAAAMHFVRWR